MTQQAPPRAQSAPPWQRERGLAPVVRRWLESPETADNFRAQHRLSAKQAGYCAALPSVDAALLTSLRARGLTSLYTHQARAIQAALDGKHVVIATPTASGKSLCFHLPVLEGLGRTPSATALYLYPTKALSRDQEHGLLSLIEGAALGLSAMVFDGDTPGDARRAVRERARIVLSNPDMLHAGILPNHQRWAAFFEGLKYVVLDEVHTYRGVFGSHMAHVIARLKRVARFHGSEPVFLCATATIGNPLSHAAQLLGVDESSIALVDQSTAPSPGRLTLLYNPPLVNRELGIRASALKHAVNLASDLVRARVPTLVFGPSRNSVEVILKYLRERHAGDLPPSALMAYRGGYLPETRRKVEQGLRDGKIVCVVATNALELGIDIGELSAVVCVGYPGSVAGLWQRFGRAGRREQESLAVLVCNSTPTDQFLARTPSYIFDTPAEEARIDPTNLEIVLQHLKCACFEAPFQLTSPGPAPAAPRPAEGDAYARLDPAETREALQYLSEHGLVFAQDGHYSYCGDAFPATHVSLRSIGWDNFVIIDLDTNKSLAELDWRATHTMLHEQAIYQQDAEQYQVERLDYDNHKAYVRKVAPDYFTTALTHRSVEVLERHAQETLGMLTKNVGDVKVIEKVTGYKKIKFFTHENAGYGDVHLPEMQMHTVSFWLTLPESTISKLDYPRATLVDALRALGVALKTVACLSLMCDPQDLHRSLGAGVVQGLNPAELAASSHASNPRAALFNPSIFLFDAVPGGVGLAPRLYDRASELFERARRLIAECPCPAGCPACIGPKAELGSAPSKQLARVLLDLTLE